MFKRSLKAGIGILILWALFSTGPLASHGTTEVSTDRTPALSSAIGNIPLSFIPNQGQVHQDVSFYAVTPDYTLWLTKKGLIFDRSTGDAAKDVLRFSIFDSNEDVEVSAIEPSTYRVNYFIGNDPEKWKSDIPTSEAVLFHEIYPGIDLKVYGRSRQVEYDWILMPGASIQAIRFAFENAREVLVNNEGDLVVRTSVGEFIHQKPCAFQMKRGRRIEVDCHYMDLGNHRFGFAAKNYDSSLALVIDPVVLVFSTYLGGTGGDVGKAIAIDSAKAVYLTGWTFSTEFPVKGPAQKKNRGGGDVFITKFAPSGTSLVYSTFLGGTHTEGCHCIAVDKTGCAYVVGGTMSSDFPVKNAYQPKKKGNYGDAFVTKLSASGNRLIYSTYLGGSDLNTGYSLAVDGQGSAYIAGNTTSDDFPIYNALQNYAGQTDAFITKFAPSGKKLVYSTYLGGAGGESQIKLAVDGSGAVYVTGKTSSYNFPLKNPLQSTHRWDDAFLTKINSEGTEMVFSTLLGGSSDDGACAIGLDSKRNIYLAGDTLSTDFPLKNALQKTNKGSNDIFVSKVDKTGSRLLYSTYLGSKGWDENSGMAVDSSGAVIIVGNTNSDDFPVKLPYQEVWKGSEDVVVAKLNPAGNALVFSTYLGGFDYDNGNGVCVDRAKNVYIVGITYSPDFPVKKPFQKRGGFYDAFVAKLMMGAASTAPLADKVED